MFKLFGRTGLLIFGSRFLGIKKLRVAKIFSSIALKLKSLKLPY